MFDFEQQIQSWRASLLNSGEIDAQRVDELESHLRDDIERLMAAGTSQPQAWEQALLRLGDPRTLAGEFAKLAPLARRIWVPAWVANIGMVVFTALLAWYVISRLASGRIGFLLAAHVICVTVGYVTVFAIGFLGLWAVLVHAARAESARQARAFRVAGFRLALLAAIVTAIGIGLGMEWSGQHLGRYWGWDPKEIGALSVLAWSVLLLQSFAARTMDPPLAAIAIMGNIVVCVSWFGPSLLGGLHSYGFAGSRPGMIVGGFLFIQFVAISLSLLPAGCLRLKRLRAAR